MMKAFKKTVIGAAMALALAGGAQATPINVGGVIWDPDWTFDFASVSANIYQEINAGTGEVSGYGVITSFNGKAQSYFCPSCELTFSYGGFFNSGALTLPTTLGQSIGYTGGWVNVYVDSTPDVIDPFDFTSINATNTGADAGTQLFLSMVGHVNAAGDTFVGKVDDGPKLTGTGQFDVNGGLAFENFDTNTKNGLLYQGADLTFTNGFTTFVNEGSFLKSYGSGNFAGNTIPEPGSLALAGLGLLGLGVLRRRREAK